MNITIELSEEDAACLWAEHWKTRTVPEVVQLLAETQAVMFRSSFPSEVAGVVEEFRKEISENVQSVAPAPELP